MELLDGLVVREKIIKVLKEKLTRVNRRLGMAIIQIGDDKSSNIYIKNKEKMAEYLGYYFQHIKLNSAISEEEILNIIDKLNQDENIDGIMVELPIPKKLNKEKIQNRIVPSKDIDGFTYTNIGRLVQNIDCLIPCTVKAIMDILKYYKINIEGTNVVILGRSNLIGKPLFNILINQNATVALCHSHTKNLKEITRRADILITATNGRVVITKDMIKDNAVIIDCSINVVNGKIKGDVELDSLRDKECYVTPVPGGVGVVTVAEAMNNVYEACSLKNK